MRRRLTGLSTGSTGLLVNLGFSGLPDVGLVGEIAAVHMIRSLGLTDSIGVDIQV
jgi:proteasome assembly chaperone (PAC2) family protein